MKNKILKLLSTPYRYSDRSDNDIVFIKVKTKCGVRFVCFRCSGVDMRVSVTGFDNDNNHTPHIGFANIYRKLRKVEKYEYKFNALIGFKFTDSDYWVYTNLTI